MIEGNYDLGMVLGSYFGLLFLISTYTAIGLFASTLSDNQIVAFLVGILLCFLVFNGFDAVSSLFSDGESQQWVQNLGAKSHFDSIARGVIDTRDLVYFISMTLLFLFLTFQRLKQLPR
jgi:ABC-2 type transport system permease protein